MYDVFISYKHTDDLGNLTKDHHIAKQLYNDLSRLGYRVFFSEYSLEEKGTAEFKTEIDDALGSSKVLILVLTDKKHAEAKWVKYEWNVYYTDYLNDIRKELFLFTYTENVSIGELPITLRTVQNFSCGTGYAALTNHLASIFNKPVSRFRVKQNSEVTFEDIKEAVNLDNVVFEGMEHVDPEECWKWFKFNPDIYLFVEETASHKIVAYTNTSPITEECYERIKSGTFLTTNITGDMILSFDMPYPYSLYFFSIAISPEFQNSELLFMLINALIEKFLSFAERDVFIKRMIADAVTPNGRKFCELFGMRPITTSTHDSKLYEIKMIPPEFRIISKRVKELYAKYKSVYEESPYLFTEDET